MFAYYARLAVRSFRRNKVLTALMVVAIALGIGASMTTLTVFHVLSGDPIPEKSDRLFYAQLDLNLLQDDRLFGSDFSGWTLNRHLTSRRLSPHVASLSLCRRCRHAGA